MTPLLGGGLFETRALVEAASLLIVVSGSDKHFSAL